MDETLKALRDLEEIDCDKCILQGTVLCEVCKPYHDILKSTAETEGE